MEPSGWSFDQAQYAHWRARKDKTTVVAYESGKLVVQGKGTADLVQFVIEPEVLKQAGFGYEDVLAPQAAQDLDPAMFDPHAGIDESGKGDYFGPLVTAVAYVDEPSARRLLDLGVTDSKAIKSDKKIAVLADETRRIVRGRFSIVTISPETYNRMYAKITNVNRLLAWAHARSLENLLEKVPDCPRAISDQFGRKETVQRALMERGRKIVLEQYPKAEADIAVAAASILARSEFVRRLEKLGQEQGMTLPKGAGLKVDQLAAELFNRGGRDLLGKVAKMHFRTTEKAEKLAGRS
jgi:ribonuclease HIII